MGQCLCYVLDENARAGRSEDLTPFTMRSWSERLDGHVSSQLCWLLPSCPRAVLRTQAALLQWARQLSGQFCAHLGAPWYGSSWRGSESEEGLEKISDLQGGEAFMVFIFVLNLLPLSFPPILPPCSLGLWEVLMPGVSHGQNSWAPWLHGVYSFGKSGRPRDEVLMRDPWTNSLPGAWCHPVPSCTASFSWEAILWSLFLSGDHKRASVPLPEAGLYICCGEDNM